jgi:hypothetical protein
MCNILAWLYLTHRSKSRTVRSRKREFYHLFTPRITGITTRLRSRLTTMKGQRNPIWEAMIPPARGPSVMPREVMEAINP